MFMDSPFPHRQPSSVKPTAQLLSFRRIFSDNMAEVQEDFSQLPLPDRFAHKNWKVRKEGYEDAAKRFEKTPDESDPEFRPFLQDPGLFKAAAADSNVAAQQEGLAALCAFLKYGGHTAANKSRNYTIQPIWEKALASTRPAVKSNATEALLLYVELDKSDPVVEELLPGLAHKTPKNIAATLAALTAIFHNYGTKIVDPKAVLKSLPKVFGHADKNVRAEASNLTIELYRWLKEPMKSVAFWAELKPVQQTDLEKAFEKVKEEPAPKPERLTRAQQAALAVAEESGPTGGDVGAEMGAEEEEEPADVDAFDLAEPVDVYSKIPKDFPEMIASTKWKDRKDTLDAVLNVFNTPRIKEGPFDDMMRAFAKSMKDANIAVVTVAANCVEKLALGLRKNFAKYKSTIFSPILERFKEKKQSVADALGAALDAVFQSTSLTDCLEETLGFLTNKNPQVKIETVKFLVRCLRTTKDVPPKNEVKLIADAGTKLLTESTENMRSGGAEVLGTLMKIMGERAMGPYLDGLDDIRKTKIKEYFDTAQVKAKDRPKPIVAPPKQAAPVSAAGKKVVKKAPAGTVKKSAPTPARAPTPPMDDPPPPAKPIAKALTRPGLAKPGSGLSQPKTSTLGGLKKPSGSAPTSSGIASPSRRVISPPISVASEEEAQANPSPSKFGMTRGLAGRPLSKPTQSFNETPLPQPSQQPMSALSAIEKAELEEFRLEKTRLLALTDQLRRTNATLSAEIVELQNSNATLIEDHTRDVLQIKAKETQLVRARGECDVLKQEVESTRKEAERYKREVTRLGRGSIGRERESIMLDSNNNNSRSDSPIRPTSNGHGANGIYTDHTSGYARQPQAALSRNGSGASHSQSQRPQTSSSRAQSYLHNQAISPSEEKENTDSDAMSAAGRRKISPSLTSQSTSGRQSPQRMAQSQSQATANGGAEPAENWKRAAEVTSQLKARIEAMVST